LYIELTEELTEDAYLEWTNILNHCKTYL
jgi:hypothetical protein